MNTSLRFAITLFLVIFFVFALNTNAQQPSQDIIKKAEEMLKNYKVPPPTNPPETETPQQARERMNHELKPYKAKSSTTIDQVVQPNANQFIGKQQNRKALEQLQNINAPLSLTEMRAQLGEQIKNGTRKELLPLSDQERMNEFKKFVEQDQQKRGIVPPLPPTDPSWKSYIEKQNHPKPNSVTEAYSAIEGFVFNDLNYNGAFDIGEPGMPNWTVYVYQYYQGVTFSTLTDANGNYSFTGLQADYYNPYVQDSLGWAKTQNSGNTYYYLSGTDTVRNITFGEWQIVPRSLSGMKFNDLNNNAVKDTLEPGLAGWTIVLYENNTGVYRYDTTDTFGNYRFDSLMTVGYYQISEQQQNGWYQTQPSSNGYFQPNLVGESLTGFDFGNRVIEPNYFTGMIYDDVNHNGVKDETETGLAGWTLNLSSYYSGFSTSVVTDSMGNYTIETSPALDYYFISIVMQSGWYSTTGASVNWIYRYGLGDTSIINFGNWLVPPSSIRGMKFHDLNNNGAFDSGEPGIPGWSIHARKVSDGQEFNTVTDSNGYYSFDNLTMVSNYQVSEEQQMDWIKTYPGGSYYEFSVAGDTVSEINFGNYLPPPTEALRVNTLPSYSVNANYGNAVAGEALAVWGNVHGGVVPLHYVLDYGDGTIDSGIVTDRHYIGSNHTYATAGYYTVTLTIQDNLGAIDVDQSMIRTFALPTLEIRRNMAIEKGLLYDYLNQYPDGHFTGGDIIAATGSTVLAFEENGHLASNNINTDIYAEYVNAGLTYVLWQVTGYNIYPQQAGDPDSDGDGIGAYVSSSVYANGIALLGIIGAHPTGASAQADTIRVGAYTGQTYYDLIVDALDQIAFSQTDTTEYGRGGWRYTSNAPSYGSSDNSAVQWHSLVMEAAEKLWGRSIQPFVKSELLIWLRWSQDASGGFGYTDPGNWNNVPKTGSGIGSYAALDVPSTDPAIANAISFLDTYWNVDNFGDLYAMYAVKKGMSIINNRSGVSLIGAHNWRDEYNEYLVTTQGANGTWSGTWVNGPDPLSTSFAILILTPGVSQLRPVAVIAPISSKPPTTSFQLDGSGSHHRDPNKTIVEYLWDWNDSDGVNWNTPDAVGQNPTNPGYNTPGTYRISLRVKDNSEPPLFDFDSKIVTVQSTNNPPVAVSIPPGRGPSYAARVGEPIFLDGTASWDPDSSTGDHIVAYRWDLNGNGNYFDPTDATTDTVTVVFYTEYNGTVGLRVYDSYGDSSSNIANISIVASRRDIYVEQFIISPASGQVGDSVDIVAVFKNNDASNTNCTNILIRFYDENPLTIGNQVGNNFTINLPIGYVDTVRTRIAIPSLPAGMRNFYVYLDANANIPEWDEINNIIPFQFQIGTYSSIEGIKFNDINGNGQNDGEPILSGWKIFLTGANIDTAITNIDGVYAFEHVPPGTYTISEESQAGWMQTYPVNPTSYTLDVVLDSLYEHFDFGNFEKITLTGMKFEDVNRDSLKGELEPGIPEWTISLIANNDTLVTQTDIDGQYTFTDVGPGQYIINEIQKPGWYQTYPANPPYYSITANSGKNENMLDFGNTRVAGISGMKFNDLNGNAVKDSTEVGLPNWQIVINSQPPETTMTDASGLYYFAINTPGTYSVTEIQQDGWMQTTPNPAPILFDGTQLISGVNFGNFSNATITGMKFLDANGDGIKDPNEPGLEGWTIKATKALVEKTTTTAKDGSYSFSFTASEIGTWVISEVLENGWTQTYPPNVTYSIPVQSGTHVINTDFGNFQSSSISGKKYEDVAGDSLINGDPTLNGWVIQLYKNEALVATTTTTGSGDYSFTNLTPGNYIVSESLVTGWIQTYPNNGSYSLTISSGINYTEKDFANFKLGTISGVKFNDTNGDSIKGVNEAGLNNWQILLTKNQQSDTLVTDSLGNYGFIGVPAGTYTITEVQQDGWYKTVPSTEGYIVTITSGAVITGKDFGNFKFGSITGSKFFDRDSSGTQNCLCEGPLAGFKIVLSGGPISPDTVLTDSAGVFSFNNVPAGSYTISEALSALWRQTVPAHGTPYSVSMNSGLDTSGFVFGNFHLLDTGKFRTFILSDYNKTSRATQKSGFIKGPTPGNVRDTVFIRHGFGLENPDDSGYLRIGVKRNDSSLVYGWFWHHWDVYKKSAVKTWIYNTKIWGLKLVPRSKPRRYVPRNPAFYLGFTGQKVTETYFGNAGNHLTAELTTLKTNVAASDLKITPQGFGDLIYVSRNGGPDSIFTGKSIRKIIADCDTSLTMGRKIIHGTTSTDTTYRCDVAHLNLLDSVITKINLEFRSSATKLDTISTKPLKIPGVKALYKVAYLVRDSINSTPLAHFDANYTTEEDMPIEYRLDQNYPNPFNPTTMISYQLSATSTVTIKVFDILGREVATLLENEIMEDGQYELPFDATNFASGVYFYRLTAQGVEEYSTTFTDVKKMILIR